ncbi:eukaryotic integral membrane protein-domain-containing protein [Papiliotrema laurentii]|uniref:Eukaryotic integral membrane protein-domain-containing protein n=1 Tax=Papiliotrema laurentii TaxID=5418 RepID=A0AAD9FSB2_PAPLA|nr:eukaryotic integral membrane protein-domain-containing protein [Papiliotrema laurentii]
MPAISFLPFLQTVPLATRLLTLTLVLTTIAAFVLDAYVRQDSSDESVLGLNIPWLVLVPGVSWKYPWVLLTSGFVELSIVELVVSAITLPLACRYLERIWSARELVRFVIVTIVGSNVIAFGFSWLTYLVLGQMDAFEGLPYHGLSGLQVGFLVAFTQLIPEHQVQLFGRLKVRVKTLPGLYLLLSNVLVVLLGPSPYILVQFGFFVAWVYLRFFKLSEDGLSRGDRSETFAFQYWFPPPVRPYISKAANFVYSLAVRFKVVQAWDDAPSTGGSYAMLPGPGGARAEAERRRALALKALDARLASGSPAPGAAAPSAPPTASTSAVPSASAVPVPKPVSDKEEAKKEKE